MIALVFAQTLAQALDAELTAPQIRGALCGVYVKGTTTLYERNGDVRVVPASNQKLLSVVYALKRLGPEHRFTLEIWKDTKGAWVSTDGHPTVTFADLANAKEKLNLKPGPIRVRASYASVMPPSWEWDDLANKYAAKPSAFTVDRGSFELWARGGRAVLVPTPYGVRIVPMGGSESRIDYDPGTGVLKVFGPIPKQDARMDTLAIPDPAKAAASILGGPLSYTQTIPNRPADLTLTSKPLIEIAGECLQKSDNNFAENLMLSAAAVDGPLGPKIYATAAKRFTDFLESEVGIEKGDARPLDGSGLSRHDLITPRALAKVLDFARVNWGDAWLNALAASGKGTLQNRLAGSSFKGKTGSLNSVQSLSGYVTDNSGNPHVIVLVFNNTIAPASEIRALQDSIVRKIESSRDGTVVDVL